LFEEAPDGLLNNIEMTSLRPCLTGRSDASKAQVGSLECNGIGDDARFEKKMQQLTQKLEAQFAESAKLETAIRQSLQALGM
jgi:hypothetical protein